MNIRTVTNSDIERLKEISTQTFIETFSKDNTEANLQQYIAENLTVEKLTSELQNPNSQFFFVEEDNQVLGYLKLNFDDAQTETIGGDAVEIERIYVSKEFHGKKVGQQLYEKAIEVANQRKVAYVWLGVWEQNHRAISFYKKNGFVEFDKHIFMFGAEEQTDIMMRLEL